MINFVLTYEDAIRMILECQRCRPSNIWSGGRMASQISFSLGRTKTERKSIPQQSITLLHIEYQGTDTVMLWNFLTPGKTQTEKNQCEYQEPILSISTLNVDFLRLNDEGHDYKGSCISMVHIRYDRIKSIWFHAKKPNIRRTRKHSKTRNDAKHALWLAVR